VSVFAGYSRYYDLLYRDKDYAGEAEYIAELIKRYAPDAKTVMEIGSGTGAHAAELAEMGYEVAGVDMSEGMLEAAESRRSSLPAAVAGRLEFSQGDARSARLGRKFDVVISLFHVMSYQTSNDDLAAAFETAREHLNPGGAFIFDCWYGPAVLRQWPAVTEKTLSDDSTEVYRKATPDIHVNETVVDVNYDVLVKDKSTGVTETLRETHRMRYLFTPEIELALSAAGMRLIDSRAWMKDHAPDADTWAAVFVGKV
jgi:SAM-dependent methyltransferase